MRTQLDIQRFRKTCLAIIFLVLTCFWEILVVCHAPAAEFSGLGVIPSVSTMYVTAVSGDGSRVIGWAGESYGGVADGFVWSPNDGMVFLENTTGIDSMKSVGISDDGSLIVSQLFETGVAPGTLLSSVETGTQTWLPEATYGKTYGISGDGSTIYGINPSIILPIRLPVGGFPEPLGLLPGDSDAWAYGISTDGSVVVGNSSSYYENPDPPNNNIWEHEAFRWTTETGMVGLGDLPGGEFNSNAYDVSGDGTVVVGTSETERGSEAFRWTEDDGMVALGDIPGGGRAGSAWSISADGTIIVGKKKGGGGGIFVWDQFNGPRDLVDILADQGLENINQGWNLAGGGGFPYISADGTTIAGTGTNPDGQREGWRAVIGPLPEPLAGDFDMDGDVDGADFLKWQRELGDAASLTVWETNFGLQDSDFDGDFDNDNDVDGADFLKWQRELGDAASLADWENNFGTVAASLASITGADLTSGSATTTVPEPNTLLLVALATTGLLLQRRR